VTSLCSRNHRTWRRHDLIFVSPAAWGTLLRGRDDLAALPLVTGWADRGWPLIGRRDLHGEADGVKLGLPLPPSAGKRRLAVLLPAEAVLAVTPPPSLGATTEVAPVAWRQTIAQLAALASGHGLEARVFGSLAWQMLTGLEYLTASSDLDLLLPLPRAGGATGLAASLAAIEAMAPMRLDGEFVRADGAAVNWREIHAGVPEVLVKTVHQAALFSTADFLSRAAVL
jgi:phosphoribosyl-dephospho-CoA transferase